MKQNIILIIVAMLALAGGISLQRISSTPQQPIDATSLLNTALPDLNGNMQNLSQWQGKILIINFWASWCPPCLEEIPVFISLQQQYQNKNLQFIGIAVEEQQAVAEYNAKVNINYPLLIAGDDGIKLSRALGNDIDAVPFTVIISPEGKMIHRQPGEMSKAELLKIIQPFIEKN